MMIYGIVIGVYKPTYNWGAHFVLYFTLSSQSLPSSGIKSNFKPSQVQSSR